MPTKYYKYLKLIWNIGYFNGYSKYWKTHSCLGQEYNIIYLIHVTTMGWQSEQTIIKGIVRESGNSPKGNRLEHASFWQPKSLSKIVIPLLERGKI